ncbi:MAG: cadmium-translocating P-type ATPase [Chitinivibrionales bacterium]|nr:cadmium-translocating P-type ATPase [Chitinivibrionales bacterium]
MRTKYFLINLDCANCAAKIENALKKHPAVKEVSVDFATLTLHIDTTDISAIRREMKKIEPGVDIRLTPQEQTSSSKKRSTSFNPHKELVTISIATVLFLIHLIFEHQLHNTPYSLGEYCLVFTAYILAGWNVLVSAGRTIKKGALFDENVLMAIATIGAIAIHALSEAVGVMIFYKIGEFLQNLAVSRSRNSIRALVEIKPEYANLKTDTGITKVAPQTVQPGQTIVVKAGEKIPLDGVVAEGTSLVNTAALTGEPVPLSVKPGDVVLAGEINTSGLLTITVTKTFADSSIAKLLDLVENATARKSKTEQFITKFSRYYTPSVVFLAAILALLPPLLFPGQTFHEWIYRSLVLLVISCPCALVISIPLGYFGGIGGAARSGILMKGSNFIDALAAVKTVVFDKTGTLTKGTFKVKEVVAAPGFSRHTILSLAAFAEMHSNHPIARSIIEAAAAESCSLNEEIIEHQEISGHGVVAKSIDHTIIAGNDLLMHRYAIKHDSCTSNGTVVHVADNGLYCGAITIGDELKEDAVQAVALLRMQGVETIVMLTGDNAAAARSVAQTVHVDSYHAQLLPADKVRIFEAMLTEKKHTGTIAFVGDGINDSPVLARADVGIAMGAFGSDAAIETADVVVMTDHLSKVAQALQISKKTKSIVWQNILLALSIKGLFISFGAFGLTGMWEAVFADMGTALLAVLNSTRTLSSALTSPVEKKKQPRR